LLQIEAQKLPVHDPNFSKKHGGMNTVWVACNGDTVLLEGPHEGTFGSVNQIRKHFGDKAEVSVHPQCQTNRDKRNAIKAKGKKVRA
jgi:hypothetical protein